MKVPAGAETWNWTELSKEANNVANESPQMGLITHGNARVISASRDTSHELREQAGAVLEHVMWHQIVLS